MARPNAVKSSPFRKEIEELILEGKSSRYISKWLKERGESISHNAINNYRKGPYNVKDKATKEYNEKKSKERLDKAVDKKVSDIEALDDIIEKGSELNLDIESLKPSFFDGITRLDIERLKIQAKRLVIQAARAKHYITKDEPPIVVEVKVGEMDDEERKLTKEVADALARQEENTE